MFNRGALLIGAFVTRSLGVVKMPPTSVLCVVGGSAKGPGRQRCGRSARRRWLEVQKANNQALACTGEVIGTPEPDDVYVAGSAGFGFELAQLRVDNGLVRTEVRITSSPM